MNNTIFVVFEDVPTRWGNRFPEPRIPPWPVSVFKLTSETPRRLILSPINGETKHFPTDAQGRGYVGKDEYHRLCDRARAWHSSDLDAVLRYREEVSAAWAEACIERDRIALPLFAQIADLQATIRVVDAELDQTALRIRAAASARHCPPRPSANEVSADEPSASEDLPAA